MRTANLTRVVESPAVTRIILALSMAFALAAVMGFFGS